VRVHVVGLYTGGLYSEVYGSYLGPVYTVPDCIGASRFSYRIRLLFTLRHSNPVRNAAQKSLRFGSDMKSNPVYAGAV
jgi:hypothetical protein